MSNEAGQTISCKAILTAKQPLPAPPMQLMRRIERLAAHAAQIQLNQYADTFRAAAM